MFIEIDNNLINLDKITAIEKSIFIGSRVRFRVRIATDSESWVKVIYAPDCWNNNKIIKYRRLEANNFGNNIDDEDVGLLGEIEELHDEILNDLLQQNTECKELWKYITSSITIIKHTHHNQ